MIKYQAKAASSALCKFFARYPESISDLTHQPTKRSVHSSIYSTRLGPPFCPLPQNAPHHAIPYGTGTVCTGVLKRRGSFAIILLSAIPRVPAACSRRTIQSIFMPPHSGARRGTGAGAKPSLRCSVSNDFWCLIQRSAERAQRL
jgi:hypothetical protein